MSKRRNPIGIFMILDGILLLGMMLFAVMMGVRQGVEIPNYIWVLALVTIPSVVFLGFKHLNSKDPRTHPT